MKPKSQASDGGRFYGYRVSGDGDGVAYVDPADLARSPKVKNLIEAIRRIRVEPRK